jgi:D-alanine-D-alanine ligase
MQNAMKKVAVVMGGTSHEAEVSLHSGQAVVEALITAGYEVVPVVLAEDSIATIPSDVAAVYIALHGGYGEGGGIQADLDARALPYTGPGAKASALCMDKEATKQVLSAAGLPVPLGCCVTLADAEKACPFPLPVVVKPPRDGSSVGLSKVTELEQWAEAVRLACAQDERGEALCEAYIPGRELAVGVVHGKALPVLEILAPNGWYDFHAKYAPGVSQHVYPEHDAMMERLQRLAEQACAATGCRGAVRVDFRLTDAGEPYILEINTAPGCTATSLLPDAAARAGIAFPEFCASMIERAQFGE